MLRCLRCWLGVVSCELPGTPEYAVMRIETLNATRVVNLIGFQRLVLNGSTAFRCPVVASCKPPVVVSLPRVRSSVSQGFVYVLRVPVPTCARPVSQVRRCSFCLSDLLVRRYYDRMDAVTEEFEKRKTNTFSFCVPGLHELAV
jgi:hypothetical protein